MLSSKLENLIWEGKAFPKTFCVGNTQKHVLNIPPDRFIIITDILYFPFYANYAEGSSVPVDFREIERWIISNHISTQLTILGEKNFNRFQFRNNVNFIPSSADQKYIPIPGQATFLNTYLIHTTGVSFTFSFGSVWNNLNGNTLPESTALSAPVDYGKDGNTTVYPVTQIGDLSTGDFTFTNYYARVNIPANFPATQELAYSVDSTTDINSSFRPYGNSHPICQISYVELLGSPNNVGL
jgi:hypothetical protein